MSAFYAMFTALWILTNGVVAAQMGQLKVIDTITGDDSNVRQASIVMANDEQSWRKIWSAHHESMSVGGAAPSNFHVAGAQPPHVDFRKARVLAIFGGTLPGVTGFEAAKGDPKGSTDVLRVRPLPAPTGPNSSYVGTPFALVMLNRTRRPLQVEMDMRRSPQDPPDWQVVAKFSAETKS